MAGELQGDTIITSGTVYARVYNNVGQVWNTAGTPAFEAFNAANVTDYDIAATQQSTTGRWIATMPATILSGTYYYTFYLQSGGSPAVGDSPIASGGVIDWDFGAQEVMIPALRPSTAGRSLDVSTAGDAEANVTKWLSTAVSTPTVAGVPNVNVKTWNDLTTVALPLVPTTAGRTLDVSAGGEAGIDWANVGSPTTTVDLSGTTIAITQKVDLNTIKTQTVTCAAGVTVRADVGFAGTPGAANGGFIAGSNAATTIIGLSLGGVDMSSLLVSGATTLTGAVTATNAGNDIRVNMVQISGDAVAADNLEAALDGTGFNVGGGLIVSASVTGVVGSVTGAVGSVSSTVSANIVQVNSIAVDGSGTAADPWGPV